MKRPMMLLTAIALAAAFAAPAGTAPVQIGSKKFTESVLLGEMLRQLVGASGHAVRHRRELGGTRVLWSALVAGDLDAYPEYTGTLTQEIFAGQGISGDPAIRDALARRGLRMTASLGFNDTYALGVPRPLAERLKVRRISDLKAHPELRLGFSNEFMDRSDGWPGLRHAYGLPQTRVRGLDHDLAYRGLAAGDLDVVDLYSTDAEIAYYDLRVLEDDRGYFPPYEAMVLYRADLETGAPAAVAAMRRLEGRIDAATMAALNARVKLQGESESAVAADFLAARLGLARAAVEESAWARFRRHTREHLLLVAISLSAAVLVAVPLGIATLAALIGAGGYGQPILTGIRLDDLGLILQGAVPAAALALLVQGLFELIEPLVVPRGLRLK